MRMSTDWSMIPCGGIQSAVMLMAADTTANQMTMISFELSFCMAVNVSLTLRNWHLGERIAKDELDGVENAEARAWYEQEALREVWSTRTLHRNIASQYYFRLLQSAHKEKVVDEMHQLTASMQDDKLEFIKNPVVAEFLGLQSNPDFTETELEGSIISHLQKFIMEMGKMEPAWKKVCGLKFELTSRTIVQPNGGTREVPCYVLTKTGCTGNYCKTEEYKRNFNRKDKPLFCV